jgi:hypothetical protein
VCVGYNAVVRGDRNLVKVGRSTVVGDRVTLNTCATLDTGFPAVIVQFYLASLIFVLSEILDEAENSP